ncbi:unnamed protein product [Effrenium voratum]|nr:unnamed protein product [Effrenium voratum]
MTQRLACAKIFGVPLFGLGMVLLCWSAPAFVTPSKLQPLQTSGRTAGTGAERPMEQDSMPATGLACCQAFAMVAAAAIGVQARKRRSSSRTTMNYDSFNFTPVVGSQYKFSNDVGYLPDGTPLSKAGNNINHPERMQPDSPTSEDPLPVGEYVNSVGYLPDGTPLNKAGNNINHPERMPADIHAPGTALPVSAYQADVGYLVDGTPTTSAGNNAVHSSLSTAVAPAPAAPVPAPAFSAPAPAAPAAVGSAQGVHHGIKFDYSFQKDAYADFAYTNDVGYLPDGTPMNRAGNAINHPEMIQPDPHTPGSPLPRALFVNSVGYLPDGTPMNMAGNAVNHPETIQPDLHTPGAALPASAYSADVGYLVDGTSLDAAGNNSLKPGMTASQMPASSAPAPVVSAPTTAAPASAGSAQGVHHGIKFDYSFQKDAYADFAYTNDVGYLPDGTPMNRAGNAINHPEMIQPDPHTPGSPLPRALFVNSVGYLPDGTPMNMAGNAINHPETIQPDLHTPGAALPASAYSADVGYLVDGTSLDAAGNNSLKPGMTASQMPASSAPAPVVSAPTTAAPASAGSAQGVHHAGTALRAAIPTVPPSLTASSSQAAAASFVGSTRARASAAGFLYSAQRSAHADFLFTNDVGYLPDGTPLNKAGNALNHPEQIQADPHSPGSPLPRATFVNDVGYLPDGTPMNKAGNAINHPELIQPDPHTPGSALPVSSYTADAGCLADGTPINAAGNKSIH